MIFIRGKIVTLFISAFLSAFLGSCHGAPKYGCYFWYNFSGTVRTAGITPIEGVELRSSNDPENPEAIATTDVNGIYKVVIRSYSTQENLYFIYSKPGFQIQTSTLLTTNEISSACNSKVTIVRDITLSP